MGRVEKKTFVPKDQGVVCALIFPLDVKYSRRSVYYSKNFVGRIVQGETRPAMVPTGGSGEGLTKLAPNPRVDADYIRYFAAPC